jgi:hypothetical protein
MTGMASSHPGDSLLKRPSRRRTVLRWVFLVAALALLAWTVRNQGSDISDRVSSLSIQAAVAAEAAILASLGCSVLAWRLLLASLGSRLPLAAASRIFFFGQLGKYLPGSGWTLIGHMELARDLSVPRRRAIAASVLGLALGCLTATLLGGTVMALTTRSDLASPWWFLVIPPTLLMLVEPRILGTVLDTALRVARREPLEYRPTRRAMIAATAWSLAAWAMLGIHVWLLARDLGGSGSGLSLLVLGAYAVAWLAGFLAVFAPAGLGAREAVLTFGLTSSLSSGSAALLAVTSRLLITVADLLAAAISAVAAGRHRARPAPRPPSEDG